LIHVLFNAAVQLNVFEERHCKNLIHAVIDVLFNIVWSQSDSESIIYVANSFCNIKSLFKETVLITGFKVV